MSQQNREGYDQTRDPRTGRPPLAADAERRKAEKASQPEDVSLEEEGEFEKSADARDASEADLQKEQDREAPGLNGDSEPPIANPKVDGSRSGP